MDTPASVLHVARASASPASAQRLWLVLGDGRVAAVLLDPAIEISAPLVERLAQAAGEDEKGELLEIPLPGRRSATCLHAAPAAPRGANCLDALDGDILNLLRSLNGIRVFDTVRNYNRLIALDPERRRNRMQAIAQYPAILSHVFLTPHQAYDLYGGSRHRWRMHDDELIAAVDAGRSLLPLLAERSGVTKGVFRTPAFQDNWPSLGLARPQVLHVIDGIPAHRRPTTTDELARALPVFEWLNRQRIHSPALLKRVGEEFFREGIAAAMGRFHRKYGEEALADTGDFMRAMVGFLGRQARVPMPLEASPEEGSGDPWLAAWLLRHGLWPLLAASRRWHNGLQQLRHLRAADRERLPVVLGNCRVGDWTAVELNDARALEEEGARMHHCVATRWLDCASGGARIFAMARAAGNGERATAQFDLAITRKGRRRYELYELRGPVNAAVAADGRAAARQLESLLNAPERQPAIAEAGAAAARYRAPEPEVVWLDEESERMALALAVASVTI